MSKKKEKKVDAKAGIDLEARKLARKKRREERKLSLANGKVSKKSKKSEREKATAVENVEKVEFLKRKEIMPRVDSFMTDISNVVDASQIKGICLLTSIETEKGTQIIVDGNKMSLLDGIAYIIRSTVLDAAKTKMGLGESEIEQMLAQNNPYVKKLYLTLLGDLIKRLSEIC